MLEIIYFMMGVGKEACAYAASKLPAGSPDDVINRSAINFSLTQATIERIV